MLYRHAAETTAGLGQVALVMQGLMILAVVPLSAGTAALPVLSRAVARRDGKDLRFIEGLCRLALVLGAAYRRASRSMGDSLTVELAALTRAILVRIQVPQPDF